MTLKVMTMETLEEHLKEIEDVRALAFQIVFKDHGITIDKVEVKTIIEESYNKFMALVDETSRQSKLH